MFSGSVYAGFILVLSFHHGDPEPDCVEVSTRGGAYAQDKNTSARLSAKNVGGGAYARGGAYLWDTTVIFAFSVSPFIITGLMEDERCPVGKDRTSSSGLK